MIALAFLLIRTALTVEELEAATGLDNDTVRKGLKGLHQKNLVFPQTGEHGRQTWIPAGGTFFALVMEQNPKTSDSALVVVNVESEGTNSLYSTTTSNKRQNPKTSDSGGRVVVGKVLIKTDEEISATLALLRRNGIVGGKAEEIAEDHHITDDQIELVLRWTKAEDWQNPLGMAIYRLINRVVPPELNENDHVVDCKCGQCLYLRRRQFDGVDAWMPRRPDNDGEEESEKE